MITEDKRIMPVFVFFRSRDIELEVGLILAGTLIVDIPKATKLKRRHQRLVVKILQLLAESTRDQQMPDDGVAYGWPNGQRPANADETVDNDEVMANWAKTRTVIEVRVDPHNDGMVRFGNGDLRLLGLIK